MRQGFELGDQLWHPLAQFLGVGILQAELILRAADAGFDRQILDRLHEQRDALDLGQRGSQAANHLEGRKLALFQRLEIDLNAAAVEGRVGAIDADERRQAFDRRILENDLGERLLQLRHGIETDRLRRFGHAQNHAGILHGEKSLGDDHVEIDGRHQRGRRRPRAS